ncbi:hypothetical protein ACWEOE_04895 [Amycolatopsis sp. NPDC004368]
MTVREIAPVSGSGGAIGRQADPIARSRSRLKGDLARLGGAEAKGTAISHLGEAVGASIACVRL